MLINFRNAMMTGKKWRNPYVTDGLVAMWDGEWNAAGGVHDSNAETWVDLSGNGNVLRIYLGSGGFTWGGNCARFSYTNNSASYLQSDSSSMLFGLSAATLEICADFSQTTSFGVPCAFRKSSASNRFMLYRQLDGRIDPVVSTVSSGTKHLTSTSPYDYINTKYEAITVNSNGGISFYINGALYATSQISDFATIANMGSKFGINYEGSYTESPIQGIWSAFRIAVSSRALTADEIAANYAIDKERFNLPDAT